MILLKEFQKSAKNRNRKLMESQPNQTTTTEDFIVEYVVRGTTSKLIVELLITHVTIVARRDIWRLFVKVEHKG